MPHRDQEIAMLRRELEIFMGERQSLLRVVGYAALIACLDSNRLPVGPLRPVSAVTLINMLPEETLQDALGAINAEIEEEDAAKGS